jgi:hypothetical protein
MSVMSRNLDVAQRSRILNAKKIVKPLAVTGGLIGLEEAETCALAFCYNLVYKRLHLP